MKHFAVVLSGCGHKDGAEITESVSTLISLSELGISYNCYAPDIEIETVNHSTDQSTGKRNALEESARIARGEIKSLKELNTENYDAVVFPGGFGAALHLCSWAKNGSNCEVHPEAKRVVESFHEASKPIGAFCIAPTLIAKVLGNSEVTVTIGNASDVATEIEKTGAHHVDCAVDDFVTDRENKVVTSPAYMYGEAKPHEVFKGIRKAIHEISEMA